jgi:hypothetical protein
VAAGGFLAADAVYAACGGGGADWLAWFCAADAAGAWLPAVGGGFAVGVPWGLLHLPLVLPGRLSAGTPMLAQFLIMMALSVLVTWAYLGGGRSLGAAVLLHAGQNMFGVLNNGLSAVDSGWLMAVVYGGAALIVIMLTRGDLGEEGRRIVNGQLGREWRR